jgi:hypothetical protein
VVAVAAVVGRQVQTERQALFNMLVVTVEMEYKAHLLHLLMAVQALVVHRLRVIFPVAGVVAEVLVAQQILEE